MLINEIFYSLQGEGINAGRPAIFVRLAKCNLRCSFCDTDFDHGTEMTAEEIQQAIEDYSCQFIIWTGGGAHATADRGGAGAL